MDVFDLSILAVHHAAGGGGRPISEPAAMALTAIGGLAALQGRRPARTA